MSGVAAAQHDVLGGRREAQQFGCLEHHAHPLGESQTLQTAFAAVILESLIAERQSCQLERNDASLVHQCGAKPGSQPQKQHASAVVTAKRLHGRVVDEDGRAPEGGFEVEGRPPGPQIPGLLGDAAAHNRAGDPEGHAIVLPVGGLASHTVDETLGPEPRTGIESPGSLSLEVELDVGAPDVCDQNPHGRRISGLRYPVGACLSWKR